MMKSLAKLLVLLFHPLIMTLLGMLILFNSGTSLSAVQPEVKKISLLVISLFTIVFPVSMIILLYMTKIISDIRVPSQKERFLPLSLTIIMYMFAFFIMRRIPQLSGGHIVVLFCPSVALFIALILNNFMKPSLQMLGMGFLLGLFLTLIIFYGAQIQLFFVMAVLAAGLLGTSLLVLKIHTAHEVLFGFISGFLVTGIIMSIIIL